MGEKLLYILDRCEDHEKAELIGHLFLKFLQEQLTYDEFIKSISVIERFSINDIKEFISKSEKYFEEETNFEYTSLGLTESYVGEVTVEDQDDWKSFEKYLVRGGEMHSYLTDFGKKIHTILREKLKI